MSHARLSCPRGEPRRVLWKPWSSPRPPSADTGTPAAPSEMTVNELLDVPSHEDVVEAPLRLRVVMGEYAR